MSHLSDYNQAAGRSLERLCALSDGLFAIAMTLLLLEVHLPDAAEIHAEGELWTALQAFGPKLLVSMMSFMTLGIFWVGQQSQLNQLTRADRDVAWLHIAFLFFISVMPLSTRLLAEFITFRLPVIVYWLNILLLGATLLASWIHADRSGLIRTEAGAVLEKAYYRRVTLAQALYAIGAALCFVNPLWSIIWIFAVQLGYATAIERILSRWRRRSVPR